jgi:hypothetical protein
MSDHALAEGLAGLASRVDNLAHLAEGDQSRTLEEQEDRLAKVTLVDRSGNGRHKCGLQERREPGQGGYPIRSGPPTRRFRTLPG